MGMNAGVRTHGPSGPRMNQAQAAAATAMVARPMGQQVMPAMMSEGVGQIPPHLAAAAAQSPAMVAVNQKAAAQAAAVKQNAPRANYKFAPGIRNPIQVMAMGGPQPVPQQQPQPAVLIQGQEPLTASTSAAASSQEQNQIFGESSFPIMPNMYSEPARNITGLSSDVGSAESKVRKVFISKNIGINLDSILSFLKSKRLQDNSTLWLKYQFQVSPKNIFM